MGPYILRRLGQLLVVLFGVSVLAFLLMALIPGDAAQAILGSYATEDNLTKLRSQMQLDKPMYIQYFSWLGNAFTGDLGWSYSLDRPVTDVVFPRLGATLKLAGVAFVIAVTVGLTSGIIASFWHGKWQDRLATTLALVGLSTPMFWLAMLLVLAFSVKLGWLPSGGMSSPIGGGGFSDQARHIILPAIALGLAASGVIARMTRSSMLDVMGQDYLRTARAKGLTEWIITMKHALKNGLVAIIPVIGVQIGFLLGGAVYIEVIFNWPGIGSMLINAIQTRDLLLVQGGILIVAVAYTLINLLADLVQSMIDPRIRVQ